MTASGYCVLVVAVVVVVEVVGVGVVVAVVVVEVVVGGAVVGLGVDLLAQSVMSVLMVEKRTAVSSTENLL